MSRKKTVCISSEELASRLCKKGVVLEAEELKLVVEAITDWAHEESEDGIFTLCSFRWKTPQNKYVKVTIPW